MMAKAKDAEVPVHAEDPFDPNEVARLANELFAEATGLSMLDMPTALGNTAPSALLDPPEAGIAATTSPATIPPVLADTDMGRIDLPNTSGLPPTSGMAGSSAPLGPHTPAFYWCPEQPDLDLTASAPPGLAQTAVSPRIVPDLETRLGAFEVGSIRRDFPILDERVHDRPLIWLDNAATTQKPRSVIQRIAKFYEHENSNIHRGAHALAARSTDAYEAAREKAGRFLHASSPREIVFVRGATEAINLVAQAWGRHNVQRGDEIVLTRLEHHSNIVPWQQLAAEKGAVLRVAPIDSRGQIILEEYERLLGPRTRIVSLAHVSNALGTILPVQSMVAAAHRYGAQVLVDGAQAVSHLRVDVQALDADFYVFSGHKVFGPTGIGVLYGKASLLERMLPWQGGGNMIRDVTFERTVYEAPPARFEAGTGNIADAVGLGEAIDYLERVGIENVTRHEADLLEHGMRALAEIPGLRLIGTAPEKAGVLSFVLDGRHSPDIGTALDQEGIAVRAGHHCAQPALRHFGLESTVRPSLALYNTHDEIDALVAAVRRIQAQYT